MKIDELIKKISLYKGKGTSQFWRMDKDYAYENEYISVKRLDSSNKAGGHKVFNGKQWSIIFMQKKDFSHLTNWQSLKQHLGEDLKITKVTRGRYKDCYGIRLYKMSADPSNEIVTDILNFIFEN